MSYRLKVTGLTDVKNIFAENKKIISQAVNDLSRDLRLTLPSLGVDVDLTSLKKAEEPLVLLQKQIKDAHMAAVNLMAAEFSKALDDAMESSVWSWGTDNRDIVDTGELKKSKKVVVDSDGDIHVFYGADYAAIVHYGGYFHPYGNENAKTFYPGRPWVTALIEGGGPIDQFNFSAIYRILFVTELNKLLG
tara:strand:+ start:394 stop:966 length:573 start_codon:yes stop_codon:yes gene_type:complete